MSEHSELLKIPWTREAGDGVIRDASGEVIIAYGAHPPERDKALGLLLDAAPELLALAEAVIEHKQQRGYMGAGFEDLVWIATEVVAKAKGGES